MINEILISRINELCNKHNVSANKVFIESGVGKDFIANLKKGQTTSVEKVAAIANYFNVSTDYLLGKETAPSGLTDGAGEMDPTSAKILEICAKLSPEGQALLIEQAQSLAKFHQKKDK